MGSSADLYWEEHPTKRPITDADRLSALEAFTHFYVSKSGKSEWLIRSIKTFEVLGRGYSFRDAIDSALSPAPTHEPEVER